MPGNSAIDAYSSLASEYIATFGRIEAASPLDIEFVADWARGVEGGIVDLGCGPGQWTGYLHGLGLDVVGVDPVPAFIEHARRAHPEVTFRLGEACSLDMPEASLGGVLAWYSLIHLEPDAVNEALAQIARWVRPGGGLAIGFFEADAITLFDHAVARAFAWPVQALAERVAGAGFEVSDWQRRHDPGVRPHGAIVARRKAGTGGGLMLPSDRGAARLAE